MNVAAPKPADRHVMWKVKGRKRNRDYRTREHLTQDELDRLFAALKHNRHGHRDYMVALVTFLHGLRVSELIDLGRHRLAQGHRADQASERQHRRGSLPGA